MDTSPPTTNHQPRAARSICWKEAKPPCKPSSSIVSAPPSEKRPRGALRNTRARRSGRRRHPRAARKISAGPARTKSTTSSSAAPCRKPNRACNMARMRALRAGLPDSVPGVTINRFCSFRPAGHRHGGRPHPRGRRADHHRRRRGIHEPDPDGRQQVRAQSLVRRSSARRSTWTWASPPSRCSASTTSSREDADAFAYRSHQNALRAQAEGKFDDEIVPVEVESTVLERTASRRHRDSVFNKDEGPRADTSLEALAKLKPVFHADGTVTAGNSSQTSDGAAAALVMSATKARELGLKPMARFVSFAVGGVPPGDHGHRPGGGDPESARAGRAEAGRHRRDRTERGFRGAGAGRDPRSRPRSRKA